MKEEDARHRPSSILDLTHFIMFLCSVNYYPFFYIFKCLCWCLLVSGQSKRISGFPCVEYCHVWLYYCTPTLASGLFFCFMCFLLQSLYFCSYYKKKTVKLSLFWNMEVTVWEGSEVGGCVNIGAEYTENWLLGASYNLLSECCIKR